jgi:hypothetical protein
MGVEIPPNQVVGDPYSTIRRVRVNTPKYRPRKLLIVNWFLFREKHQNLPREIASMK